MAATAIAQPKGNMMTIDASAEGIPVQSTMYGLFFEDINFGADGGLYAEKVMNRSFEYDNPLQGWKTFGKVDVRDDGPFERCPHYVRLHYQNHPLALCGLENNGYFGIGVEEGKEYKFSVWARTAGKAKTEYIDVFLCVPNTSEEVQFFTAEEVAVTSSNWKKYEIRFTSPRTEPKAALRVILRRGETPDPNSAVDLEHISLFPVETFNNDDNGLRKDIAQTLAELKPGLLRFPGGCVVEGFNLENRYQWKNSVGPVENRPININRWNFGTFERIFPDYYMSYGLGFYEFFRFAEEIGAEPLPVISCGMACQFMNDPEWNPHAKMSDLQTYIDDALDLIEFANGSSKSKWGKVRAEMGHPAPFNLKYLAVGNEQWGKDFIERLEPFVKAIRAKYPDIKIVGSSGPFLGGEWFDELWPEMRRLGADLVDEHYYSWEGFFERNADRYDNYPRTGPKVFAGEYACHGSDNKKFNHFNASIHEAAFMTGLERNADVVYMATYAPLLAHVDGWQWRPDLVWFDNLRVMRSCSYYVQQMYSTNKGSRVLPLTMDGKPVAGKDGQHQLYASCVKDDKTGEYIVKVVNLSAYSQVINLNLTNLPGALASCTKTELHSDNAVAENTLDNPDLVTPQTSDVDIKEVDDPTNEWIMGMRKAEDGSPCLADRIGGRTFAVYKFKTR